MKKPTMSGLMFSLLPPWWISTNLVRPTKAPPRPAPPGPGVTVDLLLHFTSAASAVDTPRFEQDLVQVRNSHSLYDACERCVMRDA